MPRFVHLQLHLLVFVFATTAVLGKLISLPAAHLVVWRTIFASLVAAAVVLLLGKARLFPPPRVLLQLLGIGAVVGLHWLCFFGAIRLANISICLAGMATISFFTAFTEPLLEKRRVKPLEVFLGMIVLLGILLVAGFERGNLAGLGVALVGAFLAAVFPVLNRRLAGVGRMDPMMMVTWEMAGACVVCLLMLPVLSGWEGYAVLFEWKALDWLWLLLLGLFCTVFAQAFHIHLLRHLSAYTANLAGNFEPVYGILAAALLFGEHRQLHPGFYLGAVTILLANLLHPVIPRYLVRRKSLL